MVTTLKRFGGLGIREDRLTNLALLGKLVWNMLHNKDILWVKVLSHKYMGKTSLWMNKKYNKPSITWRGIRHAITILLQVIVFVLAPETHRSGILTGQNSVPSANWSHLLT